MPQVPIIQANQRLNAESTQGFSARSDIPKLSIPDLPNSSIAAGAMREFGNNVQRNVTDVALAWQEHEDRVRLQEKQNNLDRFELDSIQSMYERKGKNAYGIPKDYSKIYDDYIKQQSADLDNYQSEKFKELATSRKNSFMEKAYSYTRGESENYEKQLADTGVDGNIARAIMFRNDDQVVANAINNAKSAYVLYAQSRGVPESTIQDKLAEIESKTHLGILKSFADDNPGRAKSYYEANAGKFYGEDSIAAEKVMTPVQRNFDAVKIAKDAVRPSIRLNNVDDQYSYIIDVLENNPKGVIDSNGSMTRYGINQKWNKEVDVSTMTRDQAIAHAKKKYNIDGLGIDNTSDAFKFVARDTIFQHGNDPQSQKMIKDANGDWQKLLQLRIEYEQSQAKTDPYVKQNLKGLLNRYYKLAGQIEESQATSPPSLEQIVNKAMNSTDDPETAEKAVNLIKSQYEMTQKSIKAARDQANDEAWKYIVQGHDVPPSVESAMDPQEVVKMRDYQQKKQADPEVYQEIRGKIVTGQQVDLKDYRWELGNKFDELVDLQQNPDKRANTRTVDEILKAGSQRYLGKKGPAEGVKSDFDKLESYQRAAQDEIDALQRRTGKPATPEDVTKIVDRLLLKGTVSGGGKLWGDANKTYLEVKPIDRESFYIEPQDDKVIKKVTDIIAQNRREFPADYLDKDGKVKEDAIIRAYTKLRLQGLNDDDIMGY